MCLQTANKLCNIKLVKTLNGRPMYGLHITTLCADPRKSQNVCRLLYERVCG